MKFVLALKIVSSTNKKNHCVAISHCGIAFSFSPALQALLEGHNASIVCHGEKAVCSAKSGIKSEWSMLIYSLFL